MFALMVDVEQAGVGLQNMDAGVTNPFESQLSVSRKPASLGSWLDFFRIDFVEIEVLPWTIVLNSYRECDGRTGCNGRCRSRFRYGEYGLD